MRNFRFSLFLLIWIAASPFSSSTANASLFKKDDWCDKWLQKDTRELAVFREDIRGLRSIKNWKKDERGSFNSAYTAEVMTELNRIFAMPRYANLDPDIKARLVAYLLVEGLVVQQERSPMVIEMAKWLEKLIDRENFSPNDLKRIKLSYASYLTRKPTYSARKHGRAVIDQSKYLFWDSVFTTGTTLVVSGTLLDLWIPVPLLSGLSIIARAANTLKGYPLTKEAHDAALALDKKLYKLMESHMPFPELTKRWNREFGLTIGKHGSINKAGALKSATSFQCQLLQNNGDPNRELQVQHLLDMTESLGEVNPFDWQEVREAFLIIRSTAINLGLTEVQGLTILSQMKKNANGWGTNATAKKSIEEILGRPWEIKKLPEQEPEGTAGN